MVLSRCEDLKAVLESVNSWGLRHQSFHCEAAQLKASEKQSRAATNGKDDALILADYCVSTRFSF